MGVPLTRTKNQREEWFDWFLHSTEMFEAWIDKPISAPRYTHSCSRYFRPCPLIAFCAMPKYDRAAALDEMETDVWNPLTDDA